MVLVDLLNLFIDCQYNNEKYETVQKENLNQDTEIKIKKSKIFTEHKSATVTLYLNNIALLFNIFNLMLKYIS